MDLHIPHNRYDLLNLLHESGAVQEERHEHDGVYVHGYIPIRLVKSVEPFVTHS